MVWRMASAPQACRHLARWCGHPAEQARTASASRRASPLLFVRRCFTHRRRHISCITLNAPACTCCTCLLSRMVTLALRAPAGCVLAVLGLNAMHPSTGSTSVMHASQGAGSGASHRRRGGPGWLIQAGHGLDPGWTCALQRDAQPPAPWLAGMTLYDNVLGCMAFSAPGLLMPSLPAPGPLASPSC